LDQKSTNLKKKIATNPPDWSGLIPILPGEGPRTRALYLAIRQLIESGRVPAGAKLPTTRDLAGRFGLSRAAAIAAFETLISEGFAEARVGAGTFVASQVPLLPTAKTSGKAPEPRPAPNLPLTVGVTAADPRTTRILRRLVTRTLAAPAPHYFHYGDPRGGHALREAIAEYLRAARGVRCDAHQILVTSGAQQGLDLLTRALIRSGDPVWIEDPCYPMARAAFEGAGARLIGVPVDEEGLDPAKGERRKLKARAVYVTPSHQFPLGVSMSMRRRLALIEWARRNKAWIIEDDYDSEFRFGGPPLTALQGMDGAGRVAYIGTFSKVLFPGLRVGYLVLPEQLLDKMVALRARTDRYPPALMEAPLAALLSEGHFAAHLRRARRKIETQRDALAETLEKYARDRLCFTVPEQGLHLVAKLTDPRIRDTALIEAARNQGVGGRALSPLYVTRKPEQGLVLGFSGFPENQLRAAAIRLCDLLD
jgi:GntR family transcriptional regulator / MocR family aminotransferase